MTKFKVLQINLTDAQVKELNRCRGSRPEWDERRIDTTFQPTLAAILAAADQYKPVCYIEAEDFEGVFETGNIGPEENIERLRRMHSLSGGDIIVDTSSSNAVYVDMLGFGDLPGISA